MVSCMTIFQSAIGANHQNRCKSSTVNFDSRSTFSQCDIVQRMSCGDCVENMPTKIVVDSVGFPGKDGEMARNQLKVVQSIPVGSV